MSFECLFIKCDFKMRIISCKKVDLRSMIILAKEIRKVGQNNGRNTSFPKCQNKSSETLEATSYEELFKFRATNGGVGAGSAAFVKATSGSVG